MKCLKLRINGDGYIHFHRGIPKGCPLSPLMAALYLKSLDEAMRTKGFYQRLMDDWVVLVKTKRQLRNLIKLTHKILNRLKLKMHPDKTFFGCIQKGFDFLGIHFGETPSISKTSLENHRAKLAQRYARNESNASIGDYIKRWSSWCAGVLRCCKVSTSRKIKSNKLSVSRPLGFKDSTKEVYHEETTNPAIAGA